MAASHLDFRKRDLGTPLSKNVEMLKYAPRPEVEDVVWLHGQGPAPILAEHLDFDWALPEAAHHCF